MWRSECVRSAGGGGEGIRGIILSRYSALSRPDILHIYRSSLSTLQIFVSMEQPGEDQEKVKDPKTMDVRHSHFKENQSRESLGRI